MLGTSEQPRALDERTIMPVQAYGVKMISMGLLNPGDKPLVWRGPMLHSVMQQFLAQRALGPARLSGRGFAARHRRRAAFADPDGFRHRRGGRDYALHRRARRRAPRHRNVPPGERRNPRRGREHELLFAARIATGASTCSATAKASAWRTAFGIPFLGEIEIDPQIRIGGDTGKPVAAFGEDAPGGKSIYAVARNVIARVEAVNAAAGAPVVQIL